MRTTIVLILWLLLGAFFWWTKSNCCSDSSLSSVLNKPNTELNSQQTFSDNKKDLNPIRKVLYDKSSSKFSTNQELDSLLLNIGQELDAGKTVSLTGFAFADEEEPEELGLLRAKEVEAFLSNKRGNLKLRSEVIGEPYSKVASFLNYEVTKDVDKTNGNQEGSSYVYEEGKKTYFFLGSVDFAESIPEEIEDQIKEIARKLNGNFCKVRLVSYADDNKKAIVWHNCLENRLIRYGVIPNKISSFYKKMGDRERETLELIITE